MPVSLVTKPLSLGLSQLRSWVSEDLADTLRSFGDAMFDVAGRELQEIESTNDWQAATWNAVNHLQTAAAGFKSASRSKALGSPLDKQFDIEKELACYLFIFACFIKLSEKKRASHVLDELEETLKYWALLDKPSAKAEGRAMLLNGGIAAYAHPLRTARLYTGLMVNYFAGEMGLKKEDKRRALPIKIVLEEPDTQPAKVLREARTRLSEL